MTIYFYGTCAVMLRSNNVVNRRKYYSPEPINIISCLRSLIWTYQKLPTGIRSLIWTY